ncbi:MAG: hypothetical protein K8R74_13255 [Bacteroidales bacterium]|nr:hypothetical protein [Bacteroidales bacterium]
MSYSYAVTAFDRGDPTIDLPSLESSLFTNKTAVIPRGTAVDRTVENLSFVTRVSGISSGIVGTAIHNPLEMINADFTVEFFGGDTLTQQALYMRVVNSTADSVVADSIALSNGSTGLSFYGIDLTATGPANAIIDTSQFGWKTGYSSSYTFSIIGEKSQPFDYEVKFVNALDAGTYTGDEVILPAGTPAPWEVRNISLDRPSSSYAVPMITVGFTQNSVLRVMKENYSDLNDFAFGLQLDMSDTTDAIQPDDVWEIKTFKPFSNTDVFTFKTQGFNEKKSTEEYSLDDIKVVPNPYYVRAQWDTDRFNKHIKFTHLPGKCRIRIFTTSGILIRTIEHNENAGDPVGYHSWILRNKENLDIASGLYIYQVTDLNSGKEKIGKFAIIL